MSGRDILFRVSVKSYLPPLDGWSSLGITVTSTFLSLPRELWLVGRNMVVVFGSAVVVVTADVTVVVALVGLGAAPKSPTFLPNSLRRPIFCLSFCLRSSFRLSFLVDLVLGVTRLLAVVLAKVVWVVI